MTIEKLKEILMKVYDKDTAHENWRSKWSEENVTYGQCVPTALLVQYYFGGEIYKSKQEDHYFNIIDGKVVDLTKEQFDYELDYSLSEQKQPSLSSADTKNRFELLKERVELFIEKQKNDRT